MFQESLNFVLLKLDIQTFPLNIYKVTMPVYIISQFVAIKTLVLGLSLMGMHNCEHAGNCGIIWHIIVSIIIESYDG